MPILEPHPEERRCEAVRLEGWRSEWMNTESQLAFSVLRRPGGSSEEPEPVPIPNTAVKLLSADGTKSQGLEE